VGSEGERVEKFSVALLAKKEGCRALRDLRLTAIINICIVVIIVVSAAATSIIIIIIIIVISIIIVFAIIDIIAIVINVGATVSGR
jgi:hypothetical protein